MRLKLLLYNVQDLFLRLAYPIGPRDLDRLTEGEWQLLAPRDEPLKPLFKLRGLARVLEAERPDIVMVCEAGGEESLATFSRLFLGDAYEALATPGISDRGIDTGFLIRRELPLRRELRGHAEEPVVFHYAHEEDPAAHEYAAMLAPTLNLGEPERRRLSRDVPELRLYPPSSRQPCLVLLLAHLKSALDKEGIDPQGSTRRAAEVRAVLNIRAAILQELGPTVPVIVAGDFNGRAGRQGTAPEFAPLYRDTDLEDVLELAGLPAHERITHISYFMDGGRASQLDYVFLPRALQASLDVKETHVHRYRFAEGDGELQLPGSMRDRWQLPSDHYPVVCVVQLANVVSSPQT